MLLLERIGVLRMQGFEDIEAGLARAADLGDGLAAGWEAFQFIVMVADHYSGRTSSGWFATWMWAIPPACEGRDYLGLAPSMRREPAASVTIPDLEGVGEEDAARGLAGIASALAKHLPAAAAAADNPADARACTRAADAAAEVRDLLALDG